jgi:hypothetical protein
VLVEGAVVVVAADVVCRRVVDGVEIVPTVPGCVGVESRVSA